jgi:glutamate racemase
MQETIGKGLVQLIEDGKLNSKEMTSLLSFYLKPMLANNIDSLVLGCTHYPYLIPQIKKIIGEKIQIIDSGEAVARQTQVILNKHHIANTYNNPQHIIYTNKDPAILKNLLSKYIPENLRIIKAKF